MKRVTVEDSALGREIKEGQMSENGGVYGESSGTRGLDVFNSWPISNISPSVHDSLTAAATSPIGRDLIHQPIFSHCGVVSVQRHVFPT